MTDLAGLQLWLHVDSLSRWMSARIVSSVSLGTSHLLRTELRLVPGRDREMRVQNDISTSRPKAPMKTSLSSRTLSCLGEPFWWKTMLVENPFGGK